MSAATRREPPSRTRATSLALVVSAGALGLAPGGLGATRAHTLSGTVGPGFTITMNKKVVPAGRYVITVRDLASIHDFHLIGPGVNKRTSVSGEGTTTWTVTLSKGTYTYQCDPHRAFMNGTLRVT